MLDKRYPLIEGLFPSEIANIEPHTANIVAILYGKVIPIGMSLGVGVNTHEQVVLVWRDENCSI